MSTVEIFCAACGWVGIIFMLVALWRVILAKQPRPAKPRRVAPKCSCAICGGEITAPLSEREIHNVQAGIIEVVSGATRSVVGTAEYMTTQGLGRVVLIICDDAIYTQVVDPAIRAHLQATRSST